MKHYLRLNRVVFLSSAILFVIGVSQAASSNTNLVNVGGTPDFQTGDQFKCFDTDRSVLAAEILDIGDQDAYVHIKSRNQEKLYHKGDAVGRNTGNGFSFLMIENGMEVSELLVHSDTVKLGRGTGVYLKRRVTCQKLPSVGSIGNYTITSDIFETSRLRNPNNLASSYISQAVPFAPVNLIKNAIEAKSGVILRDRGEAHLTVISPLEMIVLHEKLSMKTILDLAQVNSIQEESFQVVCIGQGQIQRSGKLLKTYFLVVRSDGADRRRALIESAFVSAGGTTKEFKAADFYPHVTIGFSDDDLHISDGIIKGSNACVGDITVRNG